MATIERSALVPFSAQQMFALVNDIESYPKFMPGCVDAKIMRRGDGWLEAQLDLALMGIQQSFTTRNVLEVPERMTLSLVDGPFRSFDGEWCFDALNETACKVKFRLKFEMSNPFAAIALPQMLKRAASQQVEALCKRAKKVYL